MEPPRPGEKKKAEGKEFVFPSGKRRGFLPSRRCEGEREGGARNSEGNGLKGKEKKRGGGGARQGKNGVLWWLLLPTVGGKKKEGLWLLGEKGRGGKKPPATILPPREEIKKRRDDSCLKQERGGGGESGCLASYGKAHGQGGGGKKPLKNAADRCQAGWEKKGKAFFFCFWLGEKKGGKKFCRRKPRRSSVSPRKVKKKEEKEKKNSEKKKKPAPFDQNHQKGREIFESLPYPVQELGKKERAVTSPKNEEPLR